MMPRVGYSRSCLAALLCALLPALSAAPARAATVALVHTHMAARSGNGSAAVFRFPPGTGTVYFDYTVAAPYTDDTAQIAVYSGGTGGAPLRKASLILDLPASFSVALHGPSGSWPDGGYCTVLYLDGVQERANGRMPIGWVVGKGHLPPACSSKLRLAALTIARLHAVLSIRLTVVDGRKRPVTGARVTIDGSSAGMQLPLSGRTGAHGRLRFASIPIGHAGTLRIRATKPGYRGDAISLPVHP